MSKPLQAQRRPLNTRARPLSWWTKRLKNPAKIPKHHLARWPYHGTRFSCDFCNKNFLLNDCQRSKIRKASCEVIVCGLKCQHAWHRQTFNAEISRRSRHKISASRLARFEGKSKWYRKVNGQHEHRTVMEKVLGRKLKHTDYVHHKDGSKRNNKPSNLVVMTPAAHARLHTLERLYGTR